MGARTTGVLKSDAFVGKNHNSNCFYWIRCNTVDVFSFFTGPIEAYDVETRRNSTGNKKVFWLKYFELEHNLLYKPYKSITQFMCVSLCTVDLKLSNWDVAKV